MKTLYLVNTGYAKQPVFNCVEWVERSDFMDSISAWRIAPKAQALQATDSYEVLCVKYEQLHGYCKVVTATIVLSGAASEYAKVNNAMQSVSEKHRAKMDLYASLLEHIAH